MTSLKQIQASASYNQFQSWNKPNHIVHVGPCRKPPLPTPRVYYTPHPRIIHEQQLPPVINLESATTVGYRIQNIPAVLKNWSLVLYGTATHPQTGHNVQQHPVNTNQGKKKKVRRKRRKIKHRRSRDNLLSIKVTGPRQLERGRRLEIICNATGVLRTPKSVKWFKDGRRFHSNPPKGVMVVKRRENHSLITLLLIEKTKIRDCGEYVCLWRKQKADSLNVHIVRRKKFARTSKFLSPFSGMTSSDNINQQAPWYFRSSQRYYKW